MFKKKRKRIKSARRSYDNNAWFIISIFLIAQALFLTSSLFQLKQVDIVGGNGFTQSNILQPLSCLIGKNIFMIRLSDIKNQFKNNFWIKDVSISYRFPGKLRILLNKKKPMALVSNVNFKNEWYEITSEGNILEKTAVKDDLLKVIVYDDVRSGLKLRQEKVLDIQKIYNTLPVDVKNKLNYIIADSDNNYSLNIKFLGYNVNVCIGDIQNLDYKLNLLAPILNKLEGLKINISYIDLRYTQPIVKVK